MKLGFVVLITPVLGFALSAATTSASQPTWSKDVAPIVYNRCAGCHRAGEGAPMSFTSYKEVRPWAKAIRERVLVRAMPPWLADPAHGSFRNDRRLPDKDIETIKAWVDAGAPEGDP